MIGETHERDDMILMNEFNKEPEIIRESMINAVRRVVESGWYVLGNEGIAFEKLWSQACGVSHSIGVGNGMDAIEITLRGLDIGPGDEIITTPITAFATVLAILRVGATPVLADIDSETGLITPESVGRCLSANTKAVLLVHLYGQMRGMSAWTEFCTKAEVLLIEDCAQAHLASSSGKKAGTFGIAGAYSFYPTKNLGALGDAGMIITNDNKLAERAATIRNYGQSIRYHHSEIGMNSRLDEIQAAILIERYKWLEEFTDKRRKISERYRAEINNPLVTQLAKPTVQSEHVFHLYVVITDHREALISHLHKHGIQALIHYPVPIHLQQPCKLIKRDPLGLSASERHADKCLSLPCHPQLTDQDIDHVIQTVNSFDIQ